MLRAAARGCVLRPAGAAALLTRRTPVALPPEGIDFDAELADFERRLIMRAYEQSGRVKARAARLLGIDRNRLRYKLEKLGVDG